MRVESFNHNWKFWLDQNAFALVWSVPDFAREVTLPHDAMLEKPAHGDSPNGGKTGFRDGGVYNYVTVLTPAEEDCGRTLMLRFDGVYQNTKVFVNEELAAKCPYGYTGFYVPLNGFLRYGEKNEIRVTVKNSAVPNSRWYTGGGIYRDVYLLTGGEAHILPEGVQVTTERASGDRAALRIRTGLKNRSSRSRDLRLECRILDGDGCERARDTAALTLFEGEERQLTRRLTLTGPRLWSAESPYLYTVETRLYEGDTLLDEDRTVTGIRTLALDAVGGLQVNGETVKLRGACIHHDSGVLGAATYYDGEYRRISLLKQAGFNAIRMSHHPAAPALLRACDELGMYVMDEAFDMWHRCKSDNDYSLFFEEWWQRDVEAMVRKDFNHPSVVLYSVGNEIPEIGTRHGALTCHALCEKIRELDPTRYTLAAINGVFAAGDRMGEIMGDIVSALPPDQLPEGDVNDFMTLQEDHMDEIVCHRAVSERLDMACAATDIAGYNYMTARYEGDAAAYPNRIMVGSETYPPEIPRNWPLVKRLSQVIGDFTWTGWDYIGEAGLGIPAYAPGEGGFGADFPCQLAYCGDLDITGFRRPQSYLREIVFGLRTRPYIAVQRPDRYGQPLFKTPWILSDADASWTYPGLEGAPVVVEVYSAGDEVELLCNGESLGRRPAGERAGWLARFETVYRPGVLEAVSWEQGRELGRFTLATAEGPCRLTAEPEPRLTEEGEGLRYVGVALIADNGVVACHEEAQLTVSPIRNVRVLGFGSGDPKPMYNMLDGTTRTFHGRALLVVRKEDAAQPAEFAISSETQTVRLFID